MIANKTPVKLNKHRKLKQQHQKKQQQKLHKLFINLFSMDKILGRDNIAAGHKLCEVIVIAIINRNIDEITVAVLVVLFIHTI